MTKKGENKPVNKLSIEKKGNGPEKEYASLNGLKITFYKFHINPMGKPRMSQYDKWKPRDVTTRYWAFKNMLVLLAKQKKFPELPEEIESICFGLEMPKSWSKKKKELMDGKPHKQRPDLDNLCKAVWDCLCYEDAHIWKIGTLEKRWTNNGYIIIALKG